MSKSSKGTNNKGEDTKRDFPNKVSQSASGQSRNDRHGSADDAPPS